MIQEEIIVLNKLGLHARPSALLAKTAGLFSSSVTLTCGKRSVDAKSILGLMTLALARGAHLTLTVDGPDEKDAAESIRTLFNGRFGEEE